MKKNLIIRILYKIYQETKLFLLKRNWKIVNFFFFNLSEFLFALLSKKPNAKIEYGPIINSDYSINQNIKIFKETVDKNPENINPRGSVYDCISISPTNFINKTKKSFGENFTHLDLGCGSGSFVYNSRELGADSVGVDNYLNRKNVPYWNSKYRNFFLKADISKDFFIQKNNKDVKFDLITLWEVFEHIETNLLSTLIENIRRHMHEQSIVVGSICTVRDENPLKKAIYHKTVQSKEWWLEFLNKNGLQPTNKHYYLPEEMLRANGIGYFDPDPKDGYSFHLIAKKYVKKIY
jgi:2-polyprenyl-3-methyl-5-hydroxy-6-metoxy-1,4-benzoquinol methylase